MAASRRKTGSLIMVALITEPLYPFREASLFSCYRQSKIQLQFMLFIPFLFSRLHLEKGRGIISQAGSAVEIFPVKVHAW